MWEAARRWFELSERLELSTTPALVPLWEQAGTVWSKLIGWANEHLPAAAASVQDGASARAWAEFVEDIMTEEWAEEGGEDQGTEGSTMRPSAEVLEALLPLRLLSAQHDGQA